MAGSIIANYLRSPPFFGKSDFDDRNLVKQLCGPTCSFDSARKLWGTKSIHDLLLLVASRRWRPFGIEVPWYSRLCDDAREYQTSREQEWINAHKKPAPVSCFSTKAIAKRKAVVRGTKVPVPVPVLVQRAKPTRGGLAPTPSETSECDMLGFTQDAISYAILCDQFGPRSSLSPEGRLLRWCLLISDSPRYHAPASFVFDESKPLAHQIRSAFAQELNDRARASSA